MFAFAYKIMLGISENIAIFRKIHLGYDRENWDVSRISASKRCYIQRITYKKYTTSFIKRVNQQISHKKPLIMTVFTIRNSIYCWK